MGRRRYFSGGLERGRESPEIRKSRLKGSEVNL